ncbi:UDP-glucuronic acid decarboxylase family protein [Streptomyces sp. NBC_00059]|uniref:UDP-glucuronic acid decarboxylase family protein n=1 Tax=Streptomyces sp. NBC_00059 TaxID=2975635 RepID=UPI00225AFDB2|nr:UDP-glucuronic acid decarboxylase family protein [Streptomyces sp. NBC_00059]MCX5415996.1 SDR family oxidoreductase [Streptomyces sp. NBC_00059]
MRTASAEQYKSPLHVLVTGGAGFIGSHLCDALLSLGHRVTCVDNYASGSPENVAVCLSHREFSLVVGDVTRRIEVDSPVDAVFHLACPASPRHYLAHPVDTLRTGSLGTLNALELARDNQARFIYASTSEIYGDPEEHPQPESYWGNVSPTGPRSVYDEAKRFGEAATAAYRRAHGLRTTIIRIFNTYGPRMLADDGRAVPAFIGQALSGRPLTIYGDGTSTRSFCYVDDLVRALLRTLESDHPGPVNLGNPEEVSVGSLAEQVQELSGTTPGVVHLPAMEDDPTRRRPDIALARQVLDWEPSVPLETGLRQTIEWFAGRTRRTEGRVTRTEGRATPSDGYAPGGQAPSRGR